MHDLCEKTAFWADWGAAESGAENAVRARHPRAGPSESGRRRAHDVRVICYGHSYAHYSAGRNFANNVLHELKEST